MTLEREHDTTATLIGNRPASGTQSLQARANPHGQGVKQTGGSPIMWGFSPAVTAPTLPTMNPMVALKVGHLAVQSPAALRATVQTKRRRLTYLPVGALLDLALATREIEQRRIPGVIIEAGTALGGSAIVIATAKSHERQLRVYDTFGMIPAPSDADGADVHERYEKITSGQSEGLGSDTYYGYRTDLCRDVERSFADFGVPIASNSISLVQGLFEDTITDDDPVALAHLDGDWYESTKVCLERISPRLTARGRIVIDDYDDWSGCRTAVDEFLSANREFCMERHARPHLVRR